MCTSCSKTLIFFLVSIICTPTSAFQQFGATYKGLLAKGRNIPTITGPSSNRYPLSVALTDKKAGSVEPGNEFTPDSPSFGIDPIDPPSFGVPDFTGLKPQPPIRSVLPASPHPAGDKLDVFASSDALRLVHGWSTDRICSASRKKYSRSVNELGLACGVWGTWQSPMVRKTDVDVDEVELLLQLGLDPNIRSERGMFPLYTAAMNNDYALCETLLKYGADKEMSILTYYGEMKPGVDTGGREVKNLIENWNPHQYHLDNKHMEGVSRLFEVFELNDMPHIDRYVLVNEMRDITHRTASEEDHPNMYALSIELDRNMMALTKRKDSVKNEMTKASVLTHCESAMIPVLVDCVTIVCSMLGMASIANQEVRFIIESEVERTFIERVAGTPIMEELRGYMADFASSTSRLETVYQLFNISMVLNRLTVIRNVVFAICAKMSWWERFYTLAMTATTITLYFLTDGGAFVLDAIVVIITVPDLIIKIEDAIEKC